MMTPVTRRTPEAMVAMPVMRTIRVAGATTGALAATKAATINAIAEIRVSHNRGAGGVRRFACWPPPADQFCETIWPLTSTLTSWVRSPFATVILYRRLLASRSISALVALPPAFCSAVAIACLRDVRAF